MDPNRHCKHCDADENKEEKCCKLHPNLSPKWLKHKRKEKVTTKTKEVVESTFYLDEDIVCTTMQQPRASGDKHALFQIKVLVKNRKVNVLFNSGSQCNMISETLVDEIGLETQDLVQPSSLAWLQREYVMRINHTCKIKFSISVSYVDEVECEVAPLDACDVMFGITYI